MTKIEATHNIAVACPFLTPVSETEESMFQKARLKITLYEKIPDIYSLVQCQLMVSLQAHLSFVKIQNSFIDMINLQYYLKKAHKTLTKRESFIYLLCCVLFVRSIQSLSVLTIIQNTVISPTHAIGKLFFFILDCELSHVTYTCQ